MEKKYSETIRRNIKDGIKTKPEPTTLSYFKLKRDVEVGNVDSGEDIVL